MSSTSPHDPVKYSSDSTARVLPRSELEGFFRTWKLHHKLSPGQLEYDGRAARVVKSFMYHGGTFCMNSRVSLGFGMNGVFNRPPSNPRLDTDPSQHRFTPLKFRLRPNCSLDSTTTKGMAYEGALRPLTSRVTGQSDIRSGQVSNRRPKTKDSPRPSRSFLLCRRRRCRAGVARA